MNNYIFTEEEILSLYVILNAFEFDLDKRRKVDDSEVYKNWLKITKQLRGRLKTIQREVYGTE